MARFTLDSATEFLFGECVNSAFEPSSLPGDQLPAVDGPTSLAPTAGFVRAFADAQYLVSRRALLGPIWKVFEIREDKSVKLMKRINTYLDPILEAALAKDEGTDKSAGIKGAIHVEDGMTFLEHMVSQTKGNIQRHTKTMPPLITSFY